MTTESRCGDDGPGAVSVSSYIHGWDETQITPDQFEQAKQEWIAQAPLNRLYWSAEYTDLVPAFQNNEVWIAYAWQGSYATLLGVDPGGHSSRARRHSCRYPLLGQAASKSGRCREGAGPRQCARPIGAAEP